MELNFNITNLTENDYSLSAEFNGKEIGRLCFEILKNPFTHAMHEFVRKSILKENLQLTNYIFLHDFYVEPLYRNNKIGTRLLTGVIGIVELKFPEYKLMLDAHPFSDVTFANDSTLLSVDKLIQFYEKFDFTYIEGFGNNIMIR
jgi:GNAT superfamily N-acetyltransferase